MLDSKKKLPVAGDESDSKKERHIVTWIPQEDDILREQVKVHGTDNWPIIASKFKDKTTRQCRRRWYTYLNSDFKKGGWSHEEDMLLCEAQKIFGNRWTEIAKVVSGRTDNAVKNRFTTLCKKRAKHEAIAKENNASCINPNGKRFILCSTSDTNGTTTASAPPSKRRSHIPDASPEEDQLQRPPFAVIAQKLHHKVGEKDFCGNGAEDANTGETFFSKDDPKVAALMQQAEFLTSLALRVNAEHTEQCLENTWKVLQSFLHQNKDGNILKYCNPEISSQIQYLTDMVVDYTSSNEGGQTSRRQPDLCEDSPASSEYSTGSTILIKMTPDRTEQMEVEVKSFGNGFYINHSQEVNTLDEHGHMISTAMTEQEDAFQTCDEQTRTEAVVVLPLSKEPDSPLQVTPVFRSLAAGIPSPKFSESERNFLMKTLGMESLSPSPSTNLVHPPSCKRSLLQSL